MEKISVIYFDDETEGPWKGLWYKNLIERNPRMICDLFRPPKLEELEEVITRAPSIFVVDYMLSVVQEDGQKAGYRGNTLAEELRNRYPEIPIVLITNSKVLDEISETSRRLISNRPSFDHYIIKNEFQEDPGAINNELVTLAQGMKKVRSTAHKNWRSLLHLLDARPVDADMLEELSPPLERGTWVTVEASEWIRGVLLRWPGITYDPIHAATLLGISMESFLNEAVQQFFEGSKYTGVFAPLEGRWWRHRIMRRAKELTLDAEVRGPLNTSFIQAFKQKYNVSLQPSICIWDGQPIADQVCYIMDKPVKRLYSLLYYPDDRPASMDSARISYRAIRNEDIDEDLIDSDAQSLINEIYEMPDPLEK